MKQPRGSLTAGQVEIMEVIWAHGKVGATVAEIWLTLSSRRQVARTTVLTMVNRLENRGWLVRVEGDGGLRFVAARGKEKAAGQMAAQFVDEMFDGSASELVRSLLGSHRITSDEIERLRELLNQAGIGKAP